MEDSYSMAGDGESQVAAKIEAPSNDYAFRSKSALVKGKLHLFGGYGGNEEKSKVLSFFHKKDKYFRLPSSTAAKSTN